MNILFNVGHPGHIHLFRNAIKELEKNKHKIIVTYKEKDIVFDLLEKYALNSVNIGSNVRGRISKAINLLKLERNFYNVCLENDIDLIACVASPHASHIGKLLDIPVLLYDDTDHKKLEFFIFSKFPTKIYTPHNFKLDFGRIHYRHNSLHELAYLHPDRFIPDIKVKEQLRIREDERCFFLRFVSWKAFHDSGQFGFTVKEKFKLINMLQTKGKILISSEGPLPKILEPFRISGNPEFIHSAMYFSDYYIGEGATMASEAAVLGVPSIYVNSLDLCYIDELEKKYDMIRRGYTLKQIKEIIEDSSFEKQPHKIKRILSDKPDFTDLILQHISNFLN